MIIGIDFDNTLVCYDELFHKVALEQRLIPADLPANKSEVRNYLRKIGREDDWTEMQGLVYGARLNEAKAFPGMLAFLRVASAIGIEMRIISHKTRHPYRGEKYDLHTAARTWLERQGVTAGIALNEVDVFFELTKAEKLARIGKCGCTHFIDDLPEFLSEPGFPEGVIKVLFDPNKLYSDSPDCLRCASWAEISDRLLSLK